jgi:hypothetical protein
MEKEKKYTGDGKELISKCRGCEVQGVETFMDQFNKRIMDVLYLWEIEDKLQQDIAVITHGICADCIKAIYPDMCHDDQ